MIHGTTKACACTMWAGRATPPSATPWEMAAAAFTLVLNDLNVGGWKLVVGELIDGRLSGEVLNV